MKTRKNKLYYSIGTIFFVLVLLAVFWFKTNETSQTAKAAAPYVRTQVIRLSEPSRNYTYAGEVRGRYESKLAFQVSGKVIKRNIELGSAVKAGDVLFKIDTRDIEQDVASSQAQIFAVRSQAKLAANDEQRYRHLYEQHVISKAEYDRYESAYDSTQAQVQQTEALYRHTTNQLGYSALQANDPGVVTSIEAEVGQIVSSGQPIVTIVQDGDREVEINIPENRLEDLRKVQQLEVEFWALPQLRVAGRVREIAPAADSVTRTYKVRIQLLNPPGEIKLGMTATVKLAVSNGQVPVVAIPLAAVYQTGDTPAVWVVHDDIAALRPVTITAFGKESVQVSSGLVSGDVIITAGVHKLREGQNVRTDGAAL